MACEQVTVPMVGKILSVDVKVGDAVSADQQLGTFESMKMEMPIFAPLAGTVASVGVSVGDAVEADQLFCEIDLK